MLKYFSLVLIFASGAVAVSPAARTAPAADSSPLGALDADRAALTSLTMVADIQTPKSNDRWATFPMYFDYSAPNKYRSEIKTGGFEGDLIGVADGAFIWSYSTKKKAVTKTPQAAAIESIRKAGPTDLLTVLATPSLTFSSLFNLVSATPKDTNTLLEITPKTAVKDYDKIQILVSSDGKTPLVAEAFKRNKIIARMIFKTYTRNAKVDMTKFTFTVPANVTVTEK